MIRENTPDTLKPTNRLLKSYKRSSRRRFVKGAVLGTLGFCTACAIDAYGVEPEWLEVVELDLPLPNLPAAFAGKKMIHISDLHCSNTVSDTYLRRCVQRINRLEADIVVITGDFVTHDFRGVYKKKILTILRELQSTLGTFACLGNHDYGVMASWQPGKEVSRDFLENGLQEVGIKVLRNNSHCLKHDGSEIYVVGLGDMWAQDSRPDLAFREVAAGKTTLVLAHNPDTIDNLQNYKAQVVMCGHTHGGQVRVPFFGPPFLPIKNRRYVSGMFTVDDKMLYVNRGLGRLGRIRFNCRPEITVFTMKEAPAKTGS
jgi:uncharacterized protein